MIGKAVFSDFFFYSFDPEKQSWEYQDKPRDKVGYTDPGLLVWKVVIPYSCRRAQTPYQEEHYG